jgi:serine/threonine-protein kinase
MIKTVEGSDTYCIVMEYIEGPSLSQAVAKGQYSIGEILTIIIQVGKALAHAHEVGIIHRDITPRNILLQGDKTPKLVDFGTAILRKGSDEVTQGVTAGTPIYMSPEQARGDMERQDGRTDIYSLGAVLYQALSGRAPFSGKSVAEILAKVQRENPPALAVTSKNIPQELISIIETAMDKNPARRYPTMNSFALQLEKRMKHSPDWFSIVPTS